MKFFIKLRNKYFSILASLALMLMASIGLFNLTATPSSVDASMIKFENETTVSISNGSFSSFSSSSAYPYEVSNYTNLGNKTPSMKTGAINISESVYKKNYDNYGLTEFGNPNASGSDNYILMINTDEDSDYTYVSKEFTFAANGSYYVTVSVKTIGDNSVASVFLLQNDTIFKDCLIENISTVGWTNYTFFVQTNSYDSLKLKFGMQIGSPSTRASGCVLFDELHAGQVSESAINNYVSNNENDALYKIVSLRGDNFYKAYNFDGIVISGTEHTPTAEKYFTLDASSGGNITINPNDNQLSLSATDEYITYKGKEEVLQPDSVYRFSIKAKLSEITSGAAYINLNEIIDEEDIYDDFMDSSKDKLTAKNSSLKITSATSNKIDDNYEEYVIYVNTNSNQTSPIKYQFEIGLGSESEHATGTVSFKQYMIEKVPYTAYSSATSGSKIGKIDLSERIKTPSNEYANYSFDKMKSESFDGVAYPATPADWSKSNSGNGKQLSGVVNVNDFDAVMNKYKKEINTMPAPVAFNNLTNNNVLMIYNGAHSYQGYTSTSKSLSANKYYKITTFVNTHLWDPQANGATVVVKTGTTILGRATNIKTLGEWQRIEFYINTPSNEVGVTIELALGYGDALSSGYAFFDNILVEESDTENKFNSVFKSYEVAENGEVKIDLNNSMLASSTNRDFNNPILYKGENKGQTNVNAGIVNLGGNLKAIIADSKVEALKDINGENDKVLAIATVLDADSYYEYTSVLSYNFESGKYYKLSFELFTDGITQEDKEEKYDNGKLAEGVNISLSGLENAKFAYLKSEGKWTIYEYYIGVDSSTTSNLTFALGSEFGGCYGRAFLGNVNLTEVDKNIFEQSPIDEFTLKVNTIKKTEDNTNTETEQSSSNGFDWAYIPTILTFLAIVVAVVGIFIRRNIKFKKRVGNKKVNYDRDITVMQNKYRRLASDRRDKDVRELTKECNELIALRAEYEEKYKDALSRLRSAKLINRDGSKRHEVAAIEHEVKHISKEVARYGVQVNNYENEIEFMQTEAYLISLEKRMMRQDEIARNQVRKEATLPEEKRLEAIKKREAKQARAQEKAELKAEKLENKQAKLEATRKAIQEQLETAKQKDEQLVKEQELLKIKVEEAKLAKEKAKAEKVLKKLEQEKASHEAEKKQIEKEMAESLEKEKIDEITEAEVVEQDKTENVETVEETAKQVEIVEETANQESVSEEAVATEDKESTKVEDVVTEIAEPNTETVEQTAETVEGAESTATENTKEANNAESTETTESVENTENGETTNNA